MSLRKRHWIINFFFYPYIPIDNSLNENLGGKVNKLTVKYNKNSQPPILSVYDHS